MLFNKVVKKEEKVQIEIKTPSYYRNGEIPYAVYYMICEDGSMVQVMNQLITISKSDFEISKAIENVEVDEDEFMVAYDKTLKLFETSIFPETLKIED